MIVFHVTFLSFWFVCALLICACPFAGLGPKFDLDTPHTRGMIAIIDSNLPHVSDMQFCGEPLALISSQLSLSKYTCIYDAFRFSPRTYTQSHTHRSKRGAGIDGPPLLSFRYVALFWNDFAFSGKALIFSTIWGIFYWWWHFWRFVTLPNIVAILDFSKK